ncbi:hypothetical protein L226DRAFT_567628 [Lentinus tigrinus ALCF2SS1-7]|uniref:F-box domain-containing protein n=1 Tax=Lentinus tigrinus ALCF2SS1-6 TaxID=1328759 RepID=A0A5C2RZP3_9APHY|nr:hypothetical protein L227DRAFT_614440 [Lentinus tigrinus ALCF2SS1-6]RPD79536.1 hypothetical protein L226DRAFT_567628 [Lentinus tigrinus ALCF2SS1-7]
MQSATHFALNSPDVLEEIFGWLGLHDHIAGDGRDALREALYAAALVCRTFSQHALDRLWHTLDEVHPLLSVLPSFRYNKDEDACMFSREATPEEWQRFELYACRVHALKYDDGYEIPVHSSAWTYLQSHCQAHGAPLLPRMKSLVLRDLSTSDLGPVLVLPGPTLRHLSISFESRLPYRLPGSAEPVFAMALDAVAAHSPDLHTLHFDHTFYLDASAVLALGRLARLSNLSFCQCDRCALPDFRAFWTASPVPASLRTLELAVQDLPADFVAGPGGLRFLQVLKVCGTSGDIDNFVRGIQPTSSRLHTVEIVSWRQWDAEFGEDSEAPPPHLSSICRSLPSTSLRSLELNLDISSATSSPCTFSAIAAALRPLSNLAAFTLHAGPKRIPISDEGVRTLGEACPRLRSLTVTQHYYNPPDSGSVTLAVLGEIARSCPALESLSLPRLAAWDCVPQPEEAEVPVAAHGLRSLEFQEVAGAAEPSFVASAIARIFPHLKLGALGDSKSLGGRKEQGEWKRVRAILCEMDEAM